MTKQGTSGSRIAYLVVVSAIFVWGILGIADMPVATYTGYNLAPQGVINQVQPGSPADDAGLMVGDEIVSMGGIPVEDVSALNRAPRVLPGDTREIGIMRDGQAMTVTLTYASLAGGQRAIAWAGVIVGLIFLFMPLLASRTGTHSGRLLGWFGACFGASFLPGPYVSSPAARNLIATVILIAILLGFAVLLRFVLSFPKDSPAAGKQATKLLVWGPAVAIALLFSFIILTEADATSGLGNFLNLLVGLFILGYFGAALFILFGKYRAASPEERSASGLSLVVLGAVLGLVPPLIGSILNLVAPMVVLPGQQYYFLSLGLIPILFSLAVMKAAPVSAGAPAHAATPA